MTTAEPRTSPRGDDNGRIPGAPSAAPRPRPTDRTVHHRVRGRRAAPSLVCTVTHDRRAPGAHLAGRAVRAGRRTRARARRPRAQRLRWLRGRRRHHPARSPASWPREGVLALRLDYLGVRPAPPFTYCDATNVVAAAPDLVRAICRRRRRPAGRPGRRPGPDRRRRLLPRWSRHGPRCSSAGPASPTCRSPGFGAIGLLSPVVPGAAHRRRQAGQGAAARARRRGRRRGGRQRAGTVALADAAKAGGVDVLLDVVAGQGHDLAGGPRPQRAADELADGVAGRICSRSSLGCAADTGGYRFGRERLQLPGPAAPRAGRHLLPAPHRGPRLARSRPAASASCGSSPRRLTLLTTRGDARHRPPLPARPPRPAGRHPRRPRGVGQRPLRRPRAAEERQHLGRRRPAVAARTPAPPS